MTLTRLGQNQMNASISVEFYKGKEVSQYKLLILEKTNQHGISKVSRKTLDSLINFSLSVIHFFPFSWTSTIGSTVENN